MTADIIDDDTLDEIAFDMWLRDGREFYQDYRAFRFEPGLRDLWLDKARAAIAGGSYRQFGGFSRVGIKSRIKSYLAK